MQLCGVLFFGSYLSLFFDFLGGLRILGNDEIENNRELIWISY